MKQSSKVNNRAFRQFSLIFGILLLAIGPVVQTLTFFPGSMSVDSHVQYSEALAGIYSDWHPPIMAFVWRLTNTIWTGPAGMLWLHLGVFWCGVYRLWLHARKQSANGALLIAFFGWLPPIMGNIGVIWKDVGLVSSIVLALSYLVGEGKRPGKDLALAAGLLVYATAVRKNGITYTLPLWVFWSWTLAQRFDMSLLTKIRRVAIICATSLVAIASCLLLISTFESSFLNTHHSHPEQGLMFYDLLNMTTDSEPDQVPEAFRSVYYSHEKLIAHRNEDSHNELIFGNAPYKLLTDDGSLSALRHAWISQISSYPSRYLRERLFIFKTTMAMSEAPYTPQHFYFSEYSFAERPLGGFAATLRNKVMEVNNFFLQTTPIFTGWFWLLVCAAVGAVASLRRSGRPLHVIFLAVSGLTYGMAYFFCSVAPDFRYQLPVIVSGYLAFALLSCSLAHRNWRQG